MRQKLKKLVSVGCALSIIAGSFGSYSPNVISVKAEIQDPETYTYADDGITEWNSCYYDISSLSDKYFIFGLESGKSQINPNYVQVNNIEQEKVIRYVTQLKYNLDSKIKEIRSYVKYNFPDVYECVNSGKDTHSLDDRKYESDIALEYDRVTWGLSRLYSTLRLVSDNSYCYNSETLSKSDEIAENAYSLLEQTYNLTVGSKCFYLHAFSEDDQVGDFRSSSHLDIVAEKLYKDYTDVKHDFDYGGSTGQNKNSYIYKFIQITNEREKVLYLHELINSGYEEAISTRDTIKQILDYYKDNQSFQDTNAVIPTPDITIDTPAPEITTVPGITATVTPSMTENVDTTVAPSTTDTAATSEPQDTSVATAVPVETSTPEETSVPAAEVQKNTISCSISKVTLGVGETWNMSLDNVDGREITYTSSNGNVEVSNTGKITAKKVGTCKVDAVCDGVKVTVSLNIRKAPKYIKFKVKSLNLKVGKSSTPKLIFSKGSDSNKITWKSSNKTVATVNNGKITAKKKGKTVISAKTYNGKSTRLKVKVK